MPNQIGSSFKDRKTLYKFFKGTFSCMHFFIDYQATIYIAKSGVIIMKQHILVTQLNFY